MKKTMLILAIAATAGTLAVLNGCASTAQLDKSGSQLWSENCGRCHSAPGGSVYSADQWDVLTTHMKVRTMIPDDDIKKITVFLKGQ